MWITIACWKMAPLNWDVTKLPILCRASFKIIFSRIILVTIEFVSIDHQIEYWIARAESQYLKLRFYFATMTILLLCTIQTRCAQFKRSEFWSRLLIIDAINVVNWSVFWYCLHGAYALCTVLMNCTPYYIHPICSEIFQRDNKWL